MTYVELKFYNKDIKNAKDFIHKIEEICEEHSVKTSDINIEVEGTMMIFSVRVPERSVWWMGE